MGFPFDTASWTDVSGAIFMGAGTSAPGTYSFIAIGLCIIALAVGQKAEASKYSNHK